MTPYYHHTSRAHVKSMTFARMRLKAPGQAHAQDCSGLRHFTSSEKRCLSRSI